MSGPSPVTLRWRRIGLLAVLALVAGLAVKRGDLRIDDRWNPWATLRIADAPGLLTPFKLSRLDRDRAQCRSVLATADLRFEPVSDRITGEGCGFDNAVRITATSAKVDTAFTLSCRAAVSLALWERHSLQPEARARFGVAVARVEHFGSYSCRNVYGRTDARRSRHASADALDIAGFVLADGRRVRVLGDWSGNDDESRFLAAIHAGACRYFDTVLGPDYNAAHRDHLHLDRGSFGICR
jgi:hypothetical protein